MSWIKDGSIWQSTDMWARPEESSEYIIGLYGRACAYADRVIAALDLEAPGSVAHWPVATQIKDVAATAASRFAKVAGDQWLREGRRSDGVRFTVETFGRNLIHEAVHHLYDVTAVRHGDPPRS